MALFLLCFWAFVWLTTSLIEDLKFDYDDTDQWRKDFRKFCAKKYKNQSPIDIITDDLKTCPSKDEFDWRINDEIDEFSVENLGYQIKITPNPPRYVGLPARLTNNFVTKSDEHSHFCLDSITFHYGQDDDNGSEHTIDGEADVLEVQFVHYSCDYSDLHDALDGDPDDPYKIAIVSVLYKLGDSNAFFEEIIANIDHLKEAGSEIEIKGVTINDLVPDLEDIEFYHYKGTLTIPTCDPFVSWHILDRKLTLSKSQLRKLRRKLLNDNGDKLAPNFRPTQSFSDPVSLCPAEKGKKHKPKWPSKKPKPIKSDFCKDEIKDGYEYDFVILYDNSCGLKQKDCDNLLEGVGMIIKELLDGNYKKVRVQTMEIRAKKNPKTIVAFDDHKLQKDADKYAKYVKDNGECTKGGKGKTNLAKALMRAKKAFDLKDDRLDKVIVVSACEDKKRKHKICTLIADKYDDKGIDVYAINLIHASSASNIITRKEVGKYLLCLVDDDPQRICRGSVSKGVSVDEFDEIIEKCLLPEVCAVPEKDDKHWPTPKPTKWPVKKPTKETRKKQKHIWRR